MKTIKNLINRLLNWHPIRNAVDAGILDLSGEGRDRYGK